MKVLSAILLLGNLEFKEESANSDQAVIVDGEGGCYYALELITID